MVRQLIVHQLCSVKDMGGDVLLSGSFIYSEKRTEHTECTENTAPSVVHSVDSNWR